MRATIITDASWCPKTKAGGWAVWISADGWKHRASGQFKAPPDDNNVAEVLAAINGLALAYRRGARMLLIQSDSVAVATALKRGKWGMKPARDLHFPSCRIEFRHVKGHTRTQDARSYVNRWCDEQARLHMKEMRHALINSNSSSSSP